MDINTDSQPALDKAVYLAKAYKAEVVLLSVIYNRGLLSGFFYEKEKLEAAKNGYIKFVERWLNTYADNLQSQGVKVSTDVAWHKPLYEGIIQKAQTHQVDLVIKSTHEHPTLKRFFFTPNDWQLLKACPIPLILAKTQTEQIYHNILAAIDPSHANDKPEMLDELIIRSAVDLSQQLKADCHVAHCYSPIEYQLWSDIGAGMGIGLGPTDFSMGKENYASYVDELKKNQRKQFLEAIEGFDIPDSKQHLEEGYPERFLPEIVQQQYCQLLVLGTVYRTGLIGSTAEKILDEVHCDILSVQIEKN